jgi:hypothetical protein
MKDDERQQVTRVNNGPNWKILYILILLLILSILGLLIVQAVLLSVFVSQTKDMLNYNGITGKYYLNVRAV